MTIDNNTEEKISELYIVKVQGGRCIDIDFQVFYDNHSFHSLGCGIMTMMIISTMTSKTMMRCSRPSVVLARPDCTRQSHSTSSSVIFDRDNEFDNDNSDDVHEKDDNGEKDYDGDDDAMQMERPGALSKEAAA